MKDKKQKDKKEKKFYSQMLNKSKNVVADELLFTTTNEIKDYYDIKEFNSNNVYDISKETTKEDKLFDYADISSYYKTRKKSYNYEKDKDDLEMSL